LRQQVDHLLGFEQQLPAFAALAVFGADQADDFFGVCHGVLPAAQAGFAKGAYAVTVLAHHLFRGKQAVTIKIDTAVARAAGLIGELGLVEEPGIVEQRA
jgi:hypothetical protein